MTPTEALTAALAEGLATYMRTQGYDGDDAGALRLAAGQVAALTPELRDRMLLGFAAPQATFYFSGDEVRAALRALGPTGTMGEGLMKLAAEYGADVIDAKATIATLEADTDE